MCPKILRIKMYNALLIFVTLLCSVLGAKLPPDYRICQHGDPVKLSACLKLAIQETLPKIKDGIPSLKLPPSDPLEIPSATIGQGTGPVHVVQNFKNFKMHGISNTIIDDAKVTFTPTSFEMIIKGHAPEYRFESDYSMDGQILLLPVQGDGKCNITLINPKIELVISGDIFNKSGGIEFLKVRSAQPDVELEKAIFNYDNLFNGNKQLGDPVNSLINENWKAVFDDLKPEVQEVINVIFTNYVNILFKKVKSHDLFTYPNSANN